MKVLKDGKEVKDAQVVFDSAGRPVFVRSDGVQYDAGAFEFRDSTPTEKTATTKETKEVTKTRRQKKLRK